MTSNEVAITKVHKKKCSLTYYTSDLTVVVDFIQKSYTKIVNYIQRSYTKKVNYIQRSYTKKVNY